MDVLKMSRADFDALPSRSWNEDIGEFDSLVILPLRRRHESGYRCMDFVAVKQGEALCRLSGCSDVLHIDGIGGYGDHVRGQGLPKLIKPVSWSVDCLPKSGLLQLFSRHTLTCGLALSSFEVFAKDEKDGQ